MPNRARATKAEWTIMVFLNAKNDLEPFSFLNFEQMAKVGSTDAVNILVEFGRPTHHHTLNGETPPFGGWSKTLRFRVTKGMKPTQTAALEDLGKVNMGAGEALSDFVNWGHKNYPAKHTMLVIWDHGQGWRRRNALNIRVDRTALNRIIRRRVAVRDRLGIDELGSHDPIPDDSHINGSFRYVSHDEDTGDKLYNREIQDALAALTADAKLDVIGFDACLMAMVETGYALRDQASVMIGSEELEPGDGWSYDKFLRPLIADPTHTDAAKLGSLVVQAYRDYYGDRDAVTLSAIDLTKIDAVASAVSKFATTAKANLDENLKVLQRARNACENYAPTYGLQSIDLGRFLDQVTKAPSVAQALKSKAAAARTAVHDSIIDNYASTIRRGKFGSEGLGIYFPRNLDEYSADPDGTGYQASNTYYPVEFVQKQKWADFLHAYLAKT